MFVYLRTKFQVSKIILTSFRQGGGVILPPPPQPPPQNEPLKSPPRLGLNNNKVSEAAVHRCSSKQVFLKISQENTCFGASF